MPCNAQHNMLFPDPGGHSKRMLCPQLAATTSPRFTRSCPIMDSKGTRTAVVSSEAVSSIYFGNFPVSKYSNPSNRFRTGNISIPAIRATSDMFSQGIMILRIPRFFAETTNGKAQSRGRNFPSSASSHKMNVDSSRIRASGLSPSPSMSPSAIARSK